jgi:hypothetical protein
VGGGGGPGWGGVSVGVQLVRMIVKRMGNNKIKIGFFTDTFHKNCEL